MSAAVASNTTDQMNVSTLSDQRISVTDDLVDACEEWNRVTISTNINPDSVVGAFSPLTSQEIAVSYMTSLKNALEKVNKIIVQTSTNIKQVVADQRAVDETANNNAQQGLDYTKPTSNGGGYRGGGGGGSKKPTEKEEEKEKEIKEKEVEETEVENKDKDLDINKVLEIFDHLPFDSFIKFMEVLAKLPAGELTELLTNESKGSELVKVLLDSPNIPEEFKALIKDVDSKKVQGAIQSILVKGKNVSEYAKLVVSDYAETAKEKAEMGINNSNNDEDFLDELGAIGDEINETVCASNKKITDNVLEIYDGANVDVTDNTMDFVRSAVDVLSEANKMSYVEVLSDVNAEQLKDNVQELVKALEFFKTLGKLDSDISSTIIKNIFG